MIRRWLVPILAILAAGVIGWVAIARLSPEKPPIVDRSGTPAAGPAETVAPPAPQEPPLTVLFGGEVRGRLRLPPCAFPGNGGLGFVRDALHELMDQRHGTGLLLDLGDLPRAPGNAGLAEATAAVEMLAEVGLGAVAVGEEDLRLGLDAWRTLKNEKSGRVVTLCANLRDDEGRELAAGTAEFLLGRRRAVVTAILSPAFEAGLREAGVPVRLAPPVAAVRAALARSGKADLVVLLSHAPPEESRALLAELKEVDLAATAHGGTDGRAEPEMVDGRPLFHPGAGWRWITGAAFPAGQASGRPRMESVIRRAARISEPRPRLPQIPIDTAFSELRKPGRLEDSFRAAADRRTGAAGPAYAGPESCKSCHSAAHSSWAAGAHARSVATLRAAGLNRVPDCLSCHATGLGAPGGFPVGEPAQAAVSCEACHGPGAAHAASQEPATVRLADARASCAACHTAEVSPNFDPVEGWKKAGHAK